MSDEKLIAALLSAPTIRDAAKAANVSESTVYSKLREYGFRKQLNEQRALILEDVRTALQAHLTNAVRVMGAICADEKVPPQTRLNAAQGILKSALKLAEVIELDTAKTQSFADAFDELI